MKRIYIYILMVSVLLLTGCRGLRQTVEVPVYVHDTAYVAKEVHDSTYIDKWHTIYINGDTVRMHDSIVVYRYKVKSDTLIQYVEKPVEVVIEQTREVARPLTWLQRTLVYVGAGSVVLLLLWLVFRLLLPRVLPTKNGN